MKYSNPGRDEFSLTSTEEDYYKALLKVVSSTLPLFNCHGLYLCGYAEKYEAVSEQHVNFLLSQVILGSSFVKTLEKFVRYFSFGSLLALLLKYCEQFVNT